ncbi:hypothetical protein V3C99_009497 [Haemonchus contortus]
MSLWAFTIFDDYTSSLSPAETSTEMVDVQTTADEETVTVKINNPLDGCILPNFDPWDRDIIPFVDLNYDPLKNCNRKFKPMTVLRKGIISATVDNVTCWGRCLVRKSELRNKRGRWVNIEDADFRCDIVESSCQDPDGNDIYQMVHAQIIETENKEEIPVDANLYDVYVILLDSTAASQATRNLPRTFQFLEKSMDAVTFPHVNKVGLNSRPNGVALWFGKSMEQVDRSLFGLPSLEPDWTFESFCQRYMDNETSLFKDYANRGYKTLLAEDWMKGTLNWPGCLGFKKQPTDHYMRPFQVALERDVSKLLKKTYSPENCIEQHQDILRYLEEFMNSYKDHPKFGWIWLSLLGHDHESGVIHADADFQRFLLDNKKKLDDSFVIFMGDHGLRGGKVTRTRLGSLDVNNPMFSMSIPKELRESTDVLSILKENAARLQTPYDIRATLLDILKYQPAVNFTDRQYMKIAGEYGISFLRSQTDVERTCKNLPIPVTYCTCQYPMEKLKRSLPLATDAGRYLIQHVNLILKERNVTGLCETLRYRYTMTIAAYAPEHVTRTYSISVKAQPPCNGEFKAIVRRTKNGFEMASKTIERLDRFEKNGNCVDDSLKHLCHCKPVPKPSKTTGKA